MNSCVQGIEFLSANITQDQGIHRPGVRPMSKDRVAKPCLPYPGQACHSLDPYQINTRILPPRSPVRYLSLVRRQICCLTTSWRTRSFRRERVRARSVYECQKAAAKGSLQIFPRMELPSGRPSWHPKPVRSREPSLTGCVTRSNEYMPRSAWRSKTGKWLKTKRSSIGRPVGINLVPRLIDHCLGRAAVCRHKEKLERLARRSIEKRNPRRIRRPSRRRRLPHRGALSVGDNGRLERCSARADGPEN